MTDALTEPSEQQINVKSFVDPLMYYEWKAIMQEAAHADLA